MARGGRFGISVEYSDVLRKLEVAISRVERGTKKATTAACEEIKRESLKQVPRDSGTLASSFSYEIQGHRRNFTASLGYGRNDKFNPKSGKRASDYMVVVHEDLTTYHPIGKAKFLEDPVRDYGSKFLSQFVEVIGRELH
ncbi:hypothetical protein D3C76_169830 [compost metagenome]